MANLEEQANEGVISTEGEHDILTQALGTDEHKDRVKGKGSYVTPSIYFNSPKNRRKLTAVVNEELERMHDKQASME
ncbi:hypothetical protein FNV43_RR05793 [Rhamnella rubrinervis]|uniref:Uncharacterized protein n=1 Tax=Rhamnella rubrinervis TaxID=2594499 RepID=A0A8K0MRY7_9ROSA|nr:hypothetical protein FNV43_RR05793 [Rhamnella rubrinervis]